MSVAFNYKEINKNIFVLVIPIVIESLLSMIASTVTMALMGQIDPLSVNAIGIGGRMTNMLWAVVRGFGMGITVACANDLGAGHSRRLKTTAMLGLSSLFILTVVCSLGMFIFAPEFITMLSGSGTSRFDEAVMYLRVTSIGVPFWSVMLTATAIFQGLGDGSTPMKMSAVYNLINLVVAATLIFGWFGLPQMGLRGAAIALVVAQVIMAAVSLVMVIRKGVFKTVSTDEPLEEMDKPMPRLWYLCKLGFPAVVENTIWNLGAIAMMRPILGFGDVSYAAHQLAMQAEGITMMPVNGFGVASTAFIGRYLGARNPELAREYYRQIFKFVIIVTGICMVPMILFPKAVMGLLTSSDEIMSLGAYYLIINAIAMIPQNLYGVQAGALRAAGHTKTPMMLSMFGQWCVRVPLTYAFVYLFNVKSVLWVWVAMATDITLRYVLGHFVFRRANVFMGAELLKSRSDRKFKRVPVDEEAEVVAHTGNSEE